MIIPKLRRTVYYPASKDQAPNILSGSRSIPGFRNAGGPADDRLRGRGDALGTDLHLRDLRPGRRLALDSGRDGHPPFRGSRDHGRVVAETVGIRCSRIAYVPGGMDTGRRRLLRRQASDQSRLQAKSQASGGCVSSFCFWYM
jgi:hypothetical protein